MVLAGCMGNCSADSPESGKSYTTSRHSDTVRTTTEDGDLSVTTITETTTDTTVIVTEDEA